MSSRTLLTEIAELTKKPTSTVTAMLSNRINHNNTHMLMKCLMLFSLIISFDILQHLLLTLNAMFIKMYLRK